MIAHQYTADGYYAGPIEDYGLLPNNSTYTAPEMREGYIPRWNGTAWKYEENHTGKEGYLNGDRHTIKDYGPLPDGWSETPPPAPEPTTEELFVSLRAARDAKLAATDYMLMPDYPLPEGTLDAVKVYRQALRDITAQDGAPWDGGGAATPWPVLD